MTMKWIGAAELVHGILFNKWYLLDTLDGGTLIRRTKKGFWYCLLLRHGQFQDLGVNGTICVDLTDYKLCNQVDIAGVKIMEAKGPVTCHV